MEGFLVGYELLGGTKYRIYYTETKTFKVSRDVIFSENEFFSMRRVGKSEDVLPSNDADYDDTEQVDDDHNAYVESDSDEPESQYEATSEIVHKEIVVEPTPPPKPLNRHQRRTIAKAFKAIIKGNWNLPRNLREAMAEVDVKVVKSGWLFRIKDCGLQKARFFA